MSTLSIAKPSSSERRPSGGILFLLAVLAALGALATNIIFPAFPRIGASLGVFPKPDRLLDVYDSARAGMNVILRKAMAAGDDPDVVARTILEAATTPRPRRRYAAGKMARQVSFLRRFVPESAFDKSLRKQNGLPV